MHEFEDDNSPRKREHDWEEEQRWMHEQEEAQRLADEASEAEKRSAAIAEMDEWFFHHFENPDSEHYYDSEDGIFVWPFGGPFDAGEMIEDNFGHRFTNEEWRDAAIDQITKDGTTEWSPTTEGDFYLHPEAEPEIPQLYLTPQISNETSRDEAMEILLARVQKMEEQVAQVPFTYGHNGPPDDVGLPPYDEVDKLTLESVAEVIRTELDKQEPDASKLKESAKKVETIGSKILAYALKSADTVTQEGLKFGAKAGIVYVGAGMFGFDLSALGATLTTLAADLVKFVSEFLK